MLTPGTIPKYLPGFRNIHSESYELYHNFDDNKLKNNQTTHPTIKLVFRGIIVVIEE